MPKDKKNKDSITDDWNLRERGRNYNQEIKYYTDVDKNEAFYAGEQWRGVQAAGLPKPVFNIFKRIINWYIAQIGSQRLTAVFSPDDAPDTATEIEEMDTLKFAKAVTGHNTDLWEKMKMDDMAIQVLLDGALAGDAYIYKYWEAGKSKKDGRIVNETIDGVNVYFGNPNRNDVQSQPYIILEFREMVSKLKAEAEEHDGEPDKISPDTDYEYQAGDLSNIELKQTMDEGGKTNAIITLRKEEENGEIKVYARKSTRHAIIRDKWDTELSRYPVSSFNWDLRKNCYRGRAPGTGLVPNQIFINKLFAMAMMSLQGAAFPRLIYNENRINGLTNTVGSMYPVNGDTRDVVKEIEGADMSNQVQSYIEFCINATREMMGANDAALGDVRPENTSAIIAVTRQSTLPLETIKRRLWSMVEQDALNTLDFMAAFYGKRKVGIMEGGKRRIEELDFNKLKKMKMNTKIDVGETSVWSELNTQQSLDNLLEREVINMKQYLKRLPRGSVPNIDELIAENEEPSDFAATLPKVIQEQIAAQPNPAQFIEQLKQLKETSPEQFEEQIRGMATQ